MKILGLHSAIGWDGNHADDMSRVHDSGATLFVDGKHIRSCLLYTSDAADE